MGFLSLSGLGWLQDFRVWQLVGFKDKGLGFRV